MPTEGAEWGSFLQAAFLAVLEAADEGLVVFDADGRCRMMGRRAGEIFGLEPATQVGRPGAEVLAALAAACEEPDAFLAEAAETAFADPKVSLDIDVRRPRPRTIRCRSTPVTWESKPAGRLIIVRDVTRERSAERTSKQLQARLTELTPFDTLTGLLNQRRFREELEREHGRSTRAWDSYAVLRFDVDGMGGLNEEFGVPVGDRVLEQLAARLKACLREYDVLARLEGDEFSVLLPGADAIAAQAVGERILAALADCALGLDDDRKVTLSVGGAVWQPPSGESGEDIVHRAGQAVIHARARGPGKIHVE